MVRVAGEKNRTGLDFYPTPSIVTRALLTVDPHVPFRVWDPACGSGGVSEVLRDSGYEVFSSDIVDRGYPNTSFIDFLRCQPLSSFIPQGIVCNPPYNQAVPFIKRALTHCDYVAVLLRLRYLKTKRFIKLFRDTHLSHVLVLGFNPQFKDLEGKKLGGHIAYAWYIWALPKVERVTISWLTREEVST